MRQDTGTFKVTDSFYLDGTPGPTYPGSGPGTVHFASGDQPIEPQQASSWTQAGGFQPGSNRPINLIVDGCRCWCPNAAVIAVVATVPTAMQGQPQTPNLTTQNRATVRNSILLSGSPTGVINVKNANSSLSCQLYLENCDVDGWFQDTDGASGISVSGLAGPAILSIGCNVRVLNAACQALSATGNAQVFMAEDFFAGQPQIDRVAGRQSGASSSTSLGWTPVPNALVACPNSVVAGEFQAPAAAATSGTSGTPLQMGSVSHPSSLANYTRIRVRLTYVPAQVYALTVGPSVGLVIESAIGAGVPNQTANGLSLLTGATNVSVNSLHFEQIIGTPVNVVTGYVTNTGDVWTGNTPLKMIQGSSFGSLVS